MEKQGIMDEERIYTFLRGYGGPRATVTRDEAATQVRGWLSGASLRDYPEDVTTD